MKKLIVLLLLPVSILSQVYNADGFLWQSKIKNKPEKTVLDYFLLLPSALLDCEVDVGGFSSEQRQKMIRTMDVQNDYIELENGSQIALFTNKINTITYIAVQIGASGQGCNCTPISTLFEFNAKSNSWIERSDRIPVNLQFAQLCSKYQSTDIAPYYHLPHKGKTIEIIDDNKSDILAKMYWNGSQFISIDVK